MRINSDRLREHLTQLGMIGCTPSGGVSRASFSAADRQAREYVTELMKKAGCQVYTDPVGNLIGRVEGSRGGPAIVMGSHIDTVPDGGQFDGALGVMAAIEVMQTLRDNNVSLDHPVEVIAFADEEGSYLTGTFGSRAMLGSISADDWNKVVSEDGTTLEQLLVSAGLAPRNLEVRDPSTVKCYLELHVEQGGVLDAKGYSIGVVEGIVGISRYLFTFKGKANHAGTTPMDMRQDALLAACQIILAVPELVKQEGDMVGTVGMLEVKPGAANVVPGEVEFVVELRALEKKKVERVLQILRQKAEGLMDYTFEVRMDKDPAWLTPWVKDIIEQVATERGYSNLRIASGAGHDAMSFAYKNIPTGMIFVPSKDGISHAPDEWTDWEDCGKGAQVLLDTLLKVDEN
ncbi:MAG: Zn-dependent hydrolase [Firmicutes bacterium]|jgi:hydantoinase/carbamoylase family amidase|nr:Zn-dependent hydrolase [Bacillota bacterium]